MEAATAARKGEGRASTDEDLPGDNGAEGREAEEVTQLSIQGDADLTSRIGGRKPDEAVIVLRGGEIKMGKTQFDKGQRARIVVEGRIAEVHDVDHTDGKTGQVTHTVKKHVLKIDHMEKMPIVDEASS